VNNYAFGLDLPNVVLAKDCQVIEDFAPENVQVFLVQQFPNANFELDNPELMLNRLEILVLLEAKQLACTLNEATQIIARKLRAISAEF